MSRVTYTPGLWHQGTYQGGTVNSGLLRYCLYCWRSFINRLKSNIRCSENSKKRNNLLVSKIVSVDRWIDDQKNMKFGNIGHAEAALCREKIILLWCFTSFGTRNSVQYDSLNTNMYIDWACDLQCLKCIVDGGGLYYNYLLNRIQERVIGVNTIPVVEYND